MNQPRHGAPVDRGEFYIPDLCAAQPVLAMVLLAQLLALVYAIMGSSLPQLDWDLLAATSLFMQWLVLLNAALLCRLRPALARLGLVPLTAAVLALVAAVTLLSSAAVLWLYPQFTGATAWPLWLGRNVLVALILAGILLRYLYLRRQLWLQEQAELRARLQSLQARIRPHFLFNTLNSIASLIALRPVEAEQAVENLSELFRASLQQGERDASLADELRLCELYLDIERLRLGERLQVEWAVDPQLRDAPMPGLILQPIVENAVYHGIAQLPEGGCVRVSVQRQGDCLQATVENPLPPRPARSSGHRIALANIEQRLAALFEDQGQLRLAREGGVYRAQLSYPLGERA